MAVPVLPSIREVRRRVVLRSGLASVGTVVLVAAYLVALLRLPREQWITFGWLVGGLFPFFFGAVTWQNERLLRPLLSVLRTEQEGGAADEAALSAAFRTTCRLPLFTFVNGVLWWLAGGAAVGTGLWWIHGAAFGGFAWAVMAAASLTGGFATTLLLCFALKAALADVRAALAARIGDVRRRAELQTRVSLAAKLRVSVTGVILVTTLFTLFLAIERANRPVERNATALQARFLALEREALARGGVGAAAARERARALGVARHVLVLDPDGGVLEGDSEALAAEERAAIAAAADAEGDSREQHSPHAFAFARLDDGRIAVAATPWSELRGSASEVRIPAAISFALAVLVSLALAQALGRDVGEAARELGERAERLASGDLRPGRAFESEDELGALARSFERMESGLRDTVGAVARAADRVEGSAGEIAAASQSVATVSGEQVRGARQAAESMELINEQIAGVSESAQALNHAVEESSASVLELGAASEELKGTAGVLFGKVEEVTVSLGEAVASVRQVNENTEALAEASGSTASSVEEMAASMREVDGSAQDAAAISLRMVETSEAGRDKVRQTIEGMDSIRQATETAERVILGLGARTQEIGAILDVIDSVADETNLLALNAAIIAAQAGEHGRGFAVVAGEIKKLAERVLSSTREIGELVRAVQAEGENAVGAIERGAASVAEGVSLSAEAGESLEEITRASRQSGERIQAIVAAVRQQTEAAAQVAALMERVNQGVAHIRRASEDQGRGNELMFASSTAMRDIAQQVRSTTEEQTNGTRGIQRNVDDVRSSVEAINGALQDQASACAQLSSFLEKVSSRMRSNEEAVVRMGDASSALLSQADDLRAAVERFRL